MHQCYSAPIVVETIKSTQGLDVESPRKTWPFPFPRLCEVQRSFADENNIETMFTCWIKYFARLLDSNTVLATLRKDAVTARLVPNRTAESHSFPLSEAE
jgi:hypothetical protein